MVIATPDAIRAEFSAAMSAMYRAEVPQYGTLIELVDQVNAAALAADPRLADAMRRSGEIDRLAAERHGAIRLGTAAELALIRRAFAVMGMHPVGYYDLAPAGVPVHSTAFRPIDEAALNRNPFRVFTSLLRLELIEDARLRREATEILSARQIMTPGVMALIERAEAEGGLAVESTGDFVAELLETFRWHSTATVSAQTYAELLDAHRLIADVISFRGPHINHLTPRTLDIDAVQAAMPAHGISPKEQIEGPPRRACPVLLRQTSFKALNEAVSFPSAQSDSVAGRHMARFGEVEQRGVALTRKGRALYDEVLAAQQQGEDRFSELPDDWAELRQRGLAYFRFRGAPTAPDRLEAAIAARDVVAEPVIYEDFLPVSAAGIFQSNLGDARRQAYVGPASRDQFEAALGCRLLDPFDLYDAITAPSIG